MLDPCLGMHPTLEPIKAEIRATGKLSQACKSPCDQGQASIYWGVSTYLIPPPPGGVHGCQGASPCTLFGWEALSPQRAWMCSLYDQ